MWAGPWKRVEATTATSSGEYRAVRERVGMIDVGTLGKFLVAGPDVVEFLERIYPMRVADLEPGRLRYGLLLEEGGVIIDDGTVCAHRATARFYLTVTTSGAERLESWMLDWRDAWGLDGLRRQPDLVARRRQRRRAARARAAAEAVRDDPLDKESFPYLRHRRITVAGVPCLAMRLGFVGELAYELHFPASRSDELWERILEAGPRVGHPPVRPAGAAPAAAREGPHHRLAGHRLRDDAVEGRHAVGGQARQARLRRQGGARCAARSARRASCWCRGRWRRAPPRPPEGATVKVGGKLAGRVTSLVVLARARPPDRAWPGCTAPSTRPRARRSLIGNAPAQRSPATPSTTRRE